MPYEKKPYKKYEKNKSWRKNGENHPSSLTLHPSSARGPLSPLMTEEQKQSATIQDLSMDFASRIIRLCQYLNDNLKIGNPDWKNIEVLEMQLNRSGTSIGANVRESNHAQSAPDFLSKMQIALKEADESDYWLSLFHNNGYLEDLEYNSLNKDLERIIKCLTSIVGTTAKKIKESKSK